MEQHTITVKLTISATSSKAARFSLEEAIRSWERFGLGTDEDEQPVEIVDFVIAP